MFITFEGGEGTGKSTQVKLLAERLRAEGKEIVTTREPGGTPEAEALRSLLVSGETTRWSAEAEALLNYAARDSHLRKIIRPALAQGKSVICDRFMDSTRAYQGFAGGCPLDLIEALEAAIVAETRPTLTLIFDLNPVVGLQRAHARGNDAEDRYERKGQIFHEQLRKGYLTIAKDEPQRCKLIDGSQSVDFVAAQVWNAIHG